MQSVYHVRRLENTLTRGESASCADAIRVPRAQTIFLVRKVNVGCEDAIRVPRV